jgi:hypothetical protein
MPNSAKLSPNSFGISGDAKVRACIRLLTTPRGKKGGNFGVWRRNWGATEALCTTSYVAIERPVFRAFRVPEAIRASHGFTVRRTLKS